jgi:PAS domain S-box-containing protein
MRERDLFEEYLQIVGNIIVALDKKGRISFINQAGCKFFKLKEKDLKGKSWFQFIPKKNRSKVKEVFLRLIKGELKPIEHYQNPIINSKGEERIISWFNKILKDKKGNIIGTLSSGEDITELKNYQKKLEDFNFELEKKVEERTRELKRSEDQIRKQYNELKQLDKLKSEFLSIASHELKTPITPILIQAQLLKKGNFGELTSKQKEGVELITKNMQRLNNLISDILDLTKLQSGVFKFNFKKDNLNSCLQEVIEEATYVAKEKKIRLVFEKSSLPKISFDYDRILQVLRNFLDNAIKFSGKGEKIVLRTKLSEKEVTVFVEDFGVGIKKKFQNKVFDPFFRGRLKKEREYKGTGLGLAVSKNIILEHYGEIGVQSFVGKGSKFYFTIPIEHKKKKGNFKTKK